MIHVQVPREHPGDCKVSETRLTFLSNQDVVLDVLGVSVGGHSTLHFTYRTNATMQYTRTMKVHETTAHLCKLLEA